MDLNKLTAAKIRETRKKSGLTAESVAHDLGISKPAYSRLENGHIEISMNKIEMLAHILNVPYSELIPVPSSNHQISHGSGDNNINASPHAQSHFIKNFFPSKDDAAGYVIETLTGIINDLKKPEK